MYRTLVLLVAASFVLAACMGNQAHHGPSGGTGGGGVNTAPGQESWADRPDLVNPGTGEVHVGEDETETAPADESPSYAPPALSG